jgi:PilZ domain
MDYVDWEDPANFDQRRRYTRRDVQLPARVRANGREVEATTENISRGGAFLRVELPEDTVDLYAFIDLPHGRGLHVQATVRWRRSSPPGVGIEFATFLGDAQDFNRAA